jgi:hypothetical protein
MLRLSWIKKGVLAIAGATAMVAQTPSSFGGLATAASKTFEVATVKLNPSGDAKWRLGPPGRGSISIDNLQLKKDHCLLVSHSGFHGLLTKVVG